MGTGGGGASPQLPCKDAETTPMCACVSVAVESGMNARARKNKEAIVIDGSQYHGSISMLGCAPRAQ
jgi:hypothetical protein